MNKFNFPGSFVVDESWLDSAPYHDAVDTGLTQKFKRSSAKDRAQQNSDESLFKPSTPEGVSQTLFSTSQISSPSSFFSQFTPQSDRPQAPSWRKEHPADRWHPGRNCPPDTGWHDSRQKPKLPHLLFSGGPTIDRGNTLRDRSFKKLNVFGDSLSDTGNLSGLFGGQFPPSPFAQSGTIKGKINGAGRLSNGNLWVEYFAEDPDINLKRQQVHNSALIGSTSGRGNVAPQTAADLGIPFPPDLKLPGVLDQIDQAFSKGISANPQALNVVWGGANDFITLLTNPTPANLVNLVLEGVNNVRTAVTQLAEKGAETIVVPNLPNLGRTPFANGQNTQGQKFVPAATLFSVGFNLLLQPMLVDLERQLKKEVDKDVDIVQIDIFSLSEDIARNPNDFGFTNTKDPLFTQSPLTSPNPDQFVFADNFHPTTAVHQEFADLFEKSLTRPVASQVLQNSELVIRDLIASADGASFLNNLLGSATVLPPGGSPSPFQQIEVFLGADVSSYAIF